jgi:hypothetical protein
VASKRLAGEVASDSLSELLIANGLTSEMKLEMFTLGRNSILLRVENIGDIFDSNGEVVYQKVNIKEFA